MLILNQGKRRKWKVVNSWARQTIYYLLFTLSAVPAAQAADHYIRAGATGSGNGSSWTNACTGFTGSCNPSSMVRGDTYWVAAGSYGAQDFSTPDSGSSVITIEAATAANHGPASDWNNSFAGQATFIGDNAISTDYWTFDGQTRGSDWQSGYNIKFWNQTDGSGAALFMGTGNGSGGNNVTLNYVEVEGTGAGFPNNNSTADKCTVDGCGTFSDSGVYENNPFNTFYVGYSYIHNTGGNQFQMNVTGSGGSVNNNTTFEYDWISYNHTGQNGHHSEAYSLYASNVVIRYNVLQDICSSGQIATAGAATPNLSNWDVYGNLFFWDATYAALNGQYGSATVDNGILDFLGEKMSGYVHFYNNTMAGFNNTVVTGNGTAFSTLAIAANSGYSSCGTSCPTVQIYNNLWYNSAYVTGDYTSYCQIVTGANCTQDYDAVYNGSVPSGDLDAPSETHGYVVTGTANPFVNSAASTIAGFEPTTPDPFAAHAGSPLASPYNLDMLGITRGANGTWDRGALQISGSTPPPTSNPCDVNGDGVVNVADVQLEVNMALGITTPCPNADGCTVVQVQRVVNAALGGTCVSL